MILLILFSIISVYVLSVLFFRTMAKANDIKGIFMLFVGFVPIINFVIAFFLFVFNKNTAEKFFNG